MGHYNPISEVRSTGLNNMSVLSESPRLTTTALPPLQAKSGRIVGLGIIYVIAGVIA